MDKKKINRYYCRTCSKELGEPHESNNYRCNTCHVEVFISKCDKNGKPEKVKRRMWCML